MFGWIKSLTAVLFSPFSRPPKRRIPPLLKIVPFGLVCNDAQVHHQTDYVQPGEEVPCYLELPRSTSVVRSYIAETPPDGMATVFIRPDGIYVRIQLDQSKDNENARDWVRRVNSGTGYPMIVSLGRFNWRDGKLRDIGDPKTIIAITLADAPLLGTSPKIVMPPLTMKTGEKFPVMPPLHPDPPSIRGSGGMEAG